MVRLESLRKQYGSHTVLDNLSLDVVDGEFLTLLGPSGSGKTTALRIIAGFVAPDGGEIHISGHNLTTLSPHLRGIGFVFQDYALFPHMTVEKNIAYGLRIRKAPPSEQRERTTELLELLDLDGLGGRYPHELSGGQQQRVALGRALALEPQVLLMDEPLSNLDTRLRDRVAGELRNLQQRLGITTIYVTHDQQEALVLSDRIAVLTDGKLQAVGTPHELYHSPPNLFSALFLGSGSTVRVQEVVGESDDIAEVRTSLGAVSVHRYPTGTTGGHVFFRPEQFVLHPDGTPAVVSHVDFRGNHQRVTAAVGDEFIIIDIPSTALIRTNETITVRTIGTGTWFFDVP